MTTRVSVATQFSGMANPAPVELLAAGYTNLAREQISSPTRATGDRRLEPGDEANRRLAGPESTPDAGSTPGDRISLGGPGGGAHPPPLALVPQQQLLQPSPPR